MPIVSDSNIVIHDMFGLDLEMKRYDEEEEKMKYTMSKFIELR